jgi:sugar lactone lactonase YvrE
MRDLTASALARLIPIALLTMSCGYQAERDEATERTQGERYAKETAAGVRASGAEDVAMGISTSEARFVRNLVGFNGPESVKYDPEQDVFFVTNQTGPGSEHDGNGYIARVSAAHLDSASVFVESGKGGAVLDSPKGTALHGDTLWVCDIDVLRAFDRHSGAPLATVDFKSQGAIQLNDIALAPDGTLHVTDTGIIMSRRGVIYKGPSRVFVLGPGRQISAIAASPQIAWPNGITWDSTGKRWIVVSFDAFIGRVYAVSPAGDSVKVLRAGSGKLDGVEMLPGGRILYASWADSSIHLLDGTTDRKILREVPEPADIGIDTRRHRLAVPLAVLGRVQIWELGAVTATAVRGY